MKSLSSCKFVFCSNLASEERHIEREARLDELKDRIIEELAEAGASFTKLHLYFF